MKSIPTLLTVFGSTLLLIGPLAAQDRRPIERPAPSRSTGGPAYTPTPMPSRTYSRPAPAFSRSTSRGSITPSTSSRPNFSNRNTPSPRNNSSSGGDTYYVPVVSYIPGYDPNYISWMSFSRFFSLFYDRYPALYDVGAAWRYSMADSPLTPEIVSTALSRPAAAANVLASLCSNLEQLIVQYQGGAMGQSEFRQLARQRTRAIREMAKAIRKDDLLELLDVRENTGAPSFAKAADLDSLLSLAQRLNATSRDLRVGLNRFSQEDMSRTVDVGLFEGRSFGSLSQEVDNLAKTIEKSSRKL